MINATWSRDIFYLIFDRLENIKDALHLAATNKCMMQWWSDYLRTHVQPFIGFRTSPRHLALILAEFRGVVGKRGKQYKHPISGHVWWLFSQKALDRMISPSLRKYFTRISISEQRLHRVTEGPNHQPTRFAQFNERHMVKSFKVRLEQKRVQARQRAAKVSINQSTLNESVVHWIVEIESLRFTYPTLWTLAINRGRANHQFIKADIERLRDHAIHGFFCCVTDRLYGEETASSVLVCRAVIKKHQNEFWQALTSGTVHHYHMNQFLTDINQAVYDFKKRIADRIIDICSDERISQLDAAHMLKRQCANINAIDSGVMRMVRRITRLKLIDIWDVIRYHMYAPSLIDKGGLVAFAANCFPHQINGRQRATSIPMDRCCIYSTLDLEVAFNSRVIYRSSSSYLGLPEQEWFIQEYRNVNIAKLAREIDWSTTVQSFFRLRNHNVVAERHTILSKIYRLQKLSKRPPREKRPNLWLQQQQQQYPKEVENEVDRAAKRARLIES